MILNAHSNFSLRYGVMTTAQVVDEAKRLGYESVALTDIENTSGVYDFVAAARAAGIKSVVGVEFRAGDRIKYVAIARTLNGFQEINEILTARNVEGEALPERPDFREAYVLYPTPVAKGRGGAGFDEPLRDNEFWMAGIADIGKLSYEPTGHGGEAKTVVGLTATFRDAAGYEMHRKLRAIDRNILLSQLKSGQAAGPSEILQPYQSVREQCGRHKRIWDNTERVMADCGFEFDFGSIKNKRTFTGDAYDDQLLLEKLAMDGLRQRYGSGNRQAAERVTKELGIIEALGFSAYFLITWDIIRYSMAQGFYHVGRGSGANSIVAYCLRITDVCPLQLDLYFERFLNPKRKSPPDFDLDYSWKERDRVLDYIFKRYGRRHTALLGGNGDV